MSRKRNNTKEHTPGQPPSKSRKVTPSASATSKSSAQQPSDSVGTKERRRAVQVEEVTDDEDDRSQGGETAVVKGPVDEAEEDAEAQLGTCTSAKRRIQATHEYTRAATGGMDRISIRILQTRCVYIS